MNIKQSIENYEKALSEIISYFSVYGYGPPENKTDVWWYSSGKNLISWEEDEKIVNNIMDIDEHDFTYSDDIVGTGFWEREEYSLALVDNGRGEHYLILLDNLKRL